jgi:hypothetical protein
MKRLFLPLFALGLALSAKPAGAFVLGQVLWNGKLVNHPWRTASMPITFVLSDRPVGLLPNLAPNSQLQTAVEAALAAWEVPPVGLRLSGAVTPFERAWDGVNLITFADTPENRDVTKNALAVTPSQWVLYSDGRARMVDTDIIVNPQHRYSTDGRETARDIQDILTHELGHALGIDHSPVVASTMYPYGNDGQLWGRTPHTDDLAAVGVLYKLDPGPGYGSIAGKVTTTTDAPIFGAHVTAVDADGIAVVGALTDWNGAFTIPSLPAGDYRVYAEPLDGPMSLENIGGPYNDQRHPASKSFRTTFVGGNLAPTAVTVAGGQSTAVAPIRVATEPPTLNPTAMFWSWDRNRWKYEIAPQLRAGSSLYLGIHGQGLDMLPLPTVEFGGSGVTVNRIVDRGASPSRSDTWVDLSVSVNSGARPGARSLIISRGEERVAFTGVLEVIK